MKRSTTFFLCHSFVCKVTNNIHIATKLHSLFYIELEMRWFDMFVM